ncbi:MAG: putative ABC exporter domain-containing protein [Acidimicrobiales bacterium]
MSNWLSREQGARGSEEPRRQGAGSDLPALAYLDRRILANSLRNIVRRPSRLVPWLIMIAWVPFFMLIRAHGHAPPPGGPKAPPVGRYIGLLVPFVPGLVLAATALAVSNGASAPPAAFSSPADARLLCGLGLDQRTVVSWAQLRRLTRPLLRTAWGFLVLVMIASQPARAHGGGLGAGHPVALVVTLTLSVMLASAVTIPAFTLSRRLPWLGRASRVIVVAGIAGAVLAGIARYRSPGGELAGVVSAAAHAVSYVSPGTLVLGGLRGSWPDIAGLAGLLVLPAAAIWAIGPIDVYPELWEASTRRFALKASMGRPSLLGFASSSLKKRPGATASRTAPPARRSLGRAGGRYGEGFVPGGAWVIAWRDWLSVSRHRSRLVRPAPILVASAAAGALIGALALPAGHPAAILGGMSGFIGEMAILGNAISTVRLGGDLAQPLFWLSAASLRRRLGVWVLASSSHQWLPVLCALAGAAAVTASPLVLVAGAPVAVFGALLLRSASLLAYAVMPSHRDMRGPGMLLRVLLTIVLLVPAGAAAGLGFAAAGVAGGIALASVASLAMSAGLVALAAVPVRRNGAGFKAAEAR